jgi:cell wall-associated NlpC family hydrolase
MTGTPTRVKRLLVAALVVVPTFVFALSTTSAAAPSQQQVESAKRQLAQLQTQFEAAVERWNTAKVDLQQEQTHLAAAKAMKDSAEKQAATARAQLAESAVNTYTGMGSSLDVLLGAQSFTEFSDKLEFIGAIAQSDADLATKADAAGQLAAWATQQYTQAVAQAQTHLSDMTSQREQIQANLEQQRQLAMQLQTERSQWLAAIAAQEAAARQAALEEQNGISGPPTDVPTVPPPPANASAAQIAISAAASVVGTQYVFGAADPGVGFDCSGLTMWSWGRAGVSLPHSAYAQYTSLPHVPLSSIQPGDIVYYGDVSPHVALYIGGGRIIHARHPGPGGQVQYDSLYGYDRPWAAMRPG